MEQTHTQEDEYMVLNAACDLASIIHKYIREHEELHKFGVTTIGYAIELIIYQQGDKWDESSSKFRDFLECAHGDLKGLVNDGSVVMVSRMAN